MTNDHNLACMPQEIIVNILRQLFKGTVIKKIKFTQHRCSRSHLKKRSWVPIMLINKNISRIARDIFSQEAAVFMFAKQLVSSKPRSGATGADKRGGERELQYFRQVVGNLYLAEHILKYTSPESIKRRSKNGYTMFENLERIYVPITRQTLSSWSTYLRWLGPLMKQSAQRDIELQACLHIFDVQQPHRWMFLLLRNNGKAELIEAAWMLKWNAEIIRRTIKEELGCDLELSYVCYPGIEDNEVVKGGRHMEWPKWSGLRRPDR